MRDESKVKLERETLSRILPVARQIVNDSLEGVETSKSVRLHVNSIASSSQSDGNKVTTVIGAIASAVVDLDHELSQCTAVSRREDRSLALDLLRLAYNRWQRDRRQLKKLMAAEDVDNSPGRPASKKFENSPEKAAQFRDLINKLIEKLSPSDLEILMLLESGSSIQEISEQMGCHRTSVSRRISRFRDILNKYEI